MKSMQYVLILFLSIISAFLGGALSVWFLMPPSVLAQGEVPKVIEAQEFRVVDGDGRMRAKFGFGSFRDEGYLAETRLIIFDAEGQDRISLVDSSIGPYLALQKDENGPTVQVSITSDGQPEIEMFQGRVGDRRVRLGLSTQGIPSLKFFDQEDIRVALGTTELKNTRTGSTEIRAVSSLVLFDEEGKVVWEAP